MCHPMKGSIEISPLHAIAFVRSFIYFGIPKQFYGHDSFFFLLRFRF